MRSFLLVVVSLILVFFGYSSYESKTYRATSEIAENSLAEPANKITAPPINAVVPQTEKSTEPLTLQNASLRQSDSLDKALHYFKNRVAFLEKCFSKRCKLPNTDSRSYEHAVYTEVEKTLETLKDWQQRHNVQDRRVSQMMTSFLAYEKSEIKVIALEILATQPKDERVVPHILKNVIEQAYPKPIGLAIQELARYKNTKHQQKMDSTLVQSLTHGSIFSAVQIAQNIEPMLTTQNRAQYQEALSELSKQPLARGIHTALRDSLAR